MPPRGEGDWRRAGERNRKFLAIGRNGHSITDCKLREGQQMSTSSDKKVLCPNSKFVWKINQVLSQSVMKIPDGKVLETKNEQKDGRQVHCAFHGFLLFTSPRALQPLSTIQRAHIIERRQREIRWSLWSGFHTTMSIKSSIWSNMRLRQRWRTCVVYSHSVPKVDAMFVFFFLFCFPFFLLFLFASSGLRPKPLPQFVESWAPTVHHLLTEHFWWHSICCWCVVWLCIRSIVSRSASATLHSVAILMGSCRASFVAVLHWETHNMQSSHSRHFFQRRNHLLQETRQVSVQYESARDLAPHQMCTEIRIKYLQCDRFRR